MKIPAIYSSVGYAPQIKKENKQQKVNQNITAQTELVSRFNDHLVSFEARVDKGMNRFFNKNKDVMPERVRALVEPMQNREVITPLEAQYYAYQGLEDAETVEDIKTIFSNPEEPLFADLKEPSQTNATRGFIHSINEMSEIYPDGVLQTKEDMTVYIVKKIFLESKTVEEINQDLDEDLDKDFKEYFKDKNPDSPYVRSSTLAALGIKMPNSEYLNSLRYTRDGYSDMVGAKIRKGLNDFINSLTPEQRTARAVRQTREFEKWWSRLTTNEKLELIADKEAEIEMLKAFKREDRAEKKRLKEAGLSVENSETEKEKPQRTHTKVGSKELSRDELFKIWATLNLKKFVASLSQADMDTLHLRRMANQTRRWNEMTPAERTDYISKMKAGAEPVRYTMIDAWNNSPEIIKALYIHLKDNQVYKPADLLYSADEFSQFQSKVMTEFWNKNPEFAQNLGDRIHLSRNKIEMAIRRGTFEDLKQEINRNKNQRKRELEAYKKSLEVPVVPEVAPKEIDYKEEFRQAYFQSEYGHVQSVPKNYFADVYEPSLETLPENIIRLWTRNLRKDKTLTMDEMLKLREALSDEACPEKVRYNRAFEFALADTIYALTKNPIIYAMPTADVKSVMYKLERGEKFIGIISQRDGNVYEFNVIKNGRIDKNRINQLYESYKKDLSEEELADIIRYNFGFKVSGEDDNERFSKGDALRIALVDYIKGYGRSANILFSDKSAYPQEVKSAFARKFFALMPSELKENGVYSHLENDMSLSTDSYIRHAQNLFGIRFRFLPPDIVNSYFKELGSMLKFEKLDGVDINTYLSKVCKKRIKASDRGSVAVLPKHRIKNPYIKYQMLAMEQALADSLYEATDNENVYKTAFEHLCDKLEVFSLVKSLPVSETLPLPTVDGSTSELGIKKRVNLSEIHKKYKEYMEEIDEWIEETEDLDKPDYQELLYILNPEEGNVTRDLAVAERMATYFPDLSELDFSSSLGGPNVKLSINPKDSSK